jgi:hypothetical protein
MPVDEISDLFLTNHPTGSLDIGVAVQFFGAQWRREIHLLQHEGFEVSRPWIWRIPSSEMLSRAAFVKADVSEERIASIIRMTRIDKRWTLAGTSNRNIKWRYVPMKRRCLQEPQGITPQKTAFLICYNMFTFKSIRYDSNNILCCVSRTVSQQDEWVGSRCSHLSFLYWHTWRHIII